MADLYIRQWQLPKQKILKKSEVWGREEKSVSIEGVTIDFVGSGNFSDFIKDDDIDPFLIVEGIKDGRIKVVLS